jgi:hypothetical protein
MAGDEQESGKQSSFKVQDRRRFSATGEAREDVEEPTVRGASSSEQAATAAPQPDTTAAPPPGDAPLHAAQDGEEITFASFVFSLSTQALVHLGEIPDPVGGTTQVQLEAARQIIDILAVLDEKTRGNLDPAESSLLESALYDLRMRYVDRARRR